ncbi:MAG: hypothetical protein IPM67_06650 [Sphingomonadales bacterium]|jgi:hypothetical protein|nr:hypothetical protein [Sphingomonadales bacterium]MBK9268325.1 hypothetical protein [Sphingomonadales bacterium]
MVIATVATRAGKMAADLALSYGASAVSSKALSSFFTGHVGAMQTSDNEMIARTGRVLEAVTVGYGLGYVAPVAVIAAGQLMLGNPLGAAKTVGTAAIGMNPAAATCAAMGAIYFGYNALSEAEREDFLNKLETGLSIGRELIKSILAFAISCLASMLNSELIKKLRGYVVEYATQFGTSIAAITKSLSDNVIVGINNAVVAAGAVSDNIGLKLTTTAAGTRNVAASTATQISDYAADATKMASNAITHVYSLISKSNDPSSKE